MTSAYGTRKCKAFPSLEKVLLDSTDIHSIWSVLFLYADIFLDFQKPSDILKVNDVCVSSSVLKELHTEEKLGVLN